MPSDRLADGGTVTIDEVEDASRYAGFLQNLREHMRAERRDLAWFQHHRAPSCECGRDLAANLIDRPIPRCDEAAHTDRLAANLSRADELFELERFEHVERRGEMLEPAARLCVARELHRCAHLVRDRAGDIIDALLVDGDDALEKRDAFFLRGLRETFERSARGLHGGIHVGCLA